MSYNTEQDAKVIALALENGNHIRFTYHGFDESDRLVAVHKLTVRKGRWFVIGYDADREGIRSFYVGDMGDVKETNLPVEVEPASL